MAHRITFKMEPVDLRKEMMRRVEEAPREHAEALLVLWDLLQTSHDEGVLELMQGLIGGKNIIAGKLAEAANVPESVNAIRNGIALARVLGTLDPEMLHRLSKNLDDAAKEHKQEEKPPSLWQIFKSAISEDGRRGLSYGVKMLVALGRAAKPETTKL